MADLTVKEKEQLLTVALVGGASLLFWYMTKDKPRKSFKTNGSVAMKEMSPQDRQYIAPPVVDESQLGNNPLADNAITALTAYINAYNAQEPQDALDELNGQIATQYGLKVIRRRTDNKLVVYDLNDNEVLVYQG